jgi:hypothetical protein
MNTQLESNFYIQPFKKSVNILSEVIDELNLDNVFKHIDNYCIEFINTLINGNFNLEKFINNVSPVIKFDLDKFKQKELNLYNITTFLNIPFNVWIIKNGIQSVDELTFGDLLKNICEKNCHNEGEYKCIFHNESLISHSIFAMLKCADHFSSKIAKKKQIQLMIIALLHDIGKFTCTCFTEWNELKVTSFPFHGECGAGVLINLWNKGFEDFFDRSDWESLVRTISIHKCGYNETTTNSNDNKFKHTLLCAESIKVKDNMYWLSIADIEGSCYKSKEEYLKFHIPFREEFRKAINKKFDIIKFKKEEGLRGCIISIAGMSGSGKSYLIKNIVDYFVSKKVNLKAILIVERDQIMANITSKRMDIPECIEKPVGDKYTKIYNEHKRLNLGSTINKKMSKIISDGIRQGKIVIVDTVANLFNGCDSMYPDSTTNAFKIAIDIIRNEPLTEKDANRINITLKKQIDIFGERSLLNWIPNGSLPNCNKLVKTGSGRLKHLTTISSSLKIDHIKKNINSKTRPHLRHQVSWYSSNENLYKLLDDVIIGIEYESDNFINEEDSDITKLISYLYSFNKHETVKQFFAEHLYVCSCPALMKGTKFENSTFYIKYLEHCRIFNLKFSRQGRGSIFMKLSSGIVCIKNLLQRGIEYLTGIHIDKNIIENEDIKITDDLSYLDQNQQIILKKFMTNKPIDGFLSFKNDGSLSGINLYPKGSEVYDVICDLIKQSTDPRDEFSKLLMFESIKENLPFLPVMCSSGTLTISELMLPYNITAICCGMYGVDYLLLSEEAKTGCTPIKAMIKYGLKQFLKSLNTFWTCSPTICKKDTMCLSFEAIVPNRRCAWNNFHPELTMSYSKSSYRFLGCMYGVGITSGQYRSHFQLEDVIINTGWETPLCWKINHTKQVDEMINGLSEIIREELTENNFIKKFPPINNTSQVFDYEGFVFFTKIFESYPIGLNTEIKDLDYDIDYGKIKTEEYYKSHKFREQNIDFLLSLPKSAEKIIPIVKAVKDFYPLLENLLVSISQKLRIVLNKISNYDHYIYHSIDNDKLKNSFKKQNFIIKSKIIINISKEWKDMVFIIYKETFNSLNDDDETNSFIKRILMKIEPWNNDTNKIISEMIENKHQIIKELFGIIIKSQGLVL